MNNNKSKVLIYARREKKPKKEPNKEGSSKMRETLLKTF
jgi:hypothetical protein